MDYRIGNCSSCGAVYKVPASFSHDTAKCKQCGGVVELGPVESGSAKKEAADEKAPPVPAKRPAPAAPAAPEPPAASSGGLEEVPVKKKKRSGPSMKEQLLARQRAAASEPADAPAPAAKRPAAKAPARKAAATSRAPRRAAPEPEEAELVAEEIEQPKARSARSSGRAGSRAGARSGGSRGRRSGGRSGGRERKKKRKSVAAPLLGGLVGLAVVGGGALFLFKDDIFPPADEEVLAADTPVEAAATAPSDVDPVAADTPADDVEPLAGEEPDEVPAETDEPEEPEEKVTKIAIDDPNDPLLDLSTIPEFGPVDDTATVEWEELQQQMATFMDVDAGAASGRAKRAIEAAGRKSFPVILNHLRTVDLTSDAGREAGRLCQRSLSEICNGINYGWYFEETVKDAKRNAKIIRKWAKEWSNAEKDIEYWIRMAKLDEKDPDQARELREKFGKKKGGTGEGADDDLLLDDDLLDEDLLDG